MAEFIVQNRSLTRFYQFSEDGSSATLVSMTEATGFATEELALEALVKAAQGMRAARKAPPLWCEAVGLDPKAVPARSFGVSSRPTLSDLVGVFDAYYVRSTSGWLSRPHTRAKTDALLRWNDSFAYAVPFPTLAAAQEALSQSWGGSGGSIIKSSNVFTQVFVDPAEAKTPDDTRSAIQSACEARDITQELEKAARDRVQALAPTEPEAEKKRAARL